MKRISKAEIQKAFISAMNEANELANEARKSDENLKEMNDMSNFEEFLSRNPLLTAGVGGSTIVLVFLGISIIMYAMCKKDSIVQLAEMAFLSNTLQSTNSKSMPVLNYQSSGPLSRSKSYACMLPEVDLISLGSNTHSMIEKMYPSLPFGNLISDQSRETIEFIEDGVRFEIIPIEKEINKEYAARPPTPHLNRKAPKSKIKYAGKVKD